MLSLAQVISWLLVYKYFIIFPLAIVEGPILMVICGFILHQGYFELLPLFAVLYIGDLVADLGWYAVGFYGARHAIERYGRFVGLTTELVSRVEKIYKAHQSKILFLSKVTMGFGFALATLIAAGAIKIPLKKFAVLNAVGGIFWTGLLISVGYAFGNLYLLIDQGFRLIFLIFFGTVFFLALWGFKNYLRQRALAGKI